VIDSVAVEITNASIITFELVACQIGSDNTWLHIFTLLGMLVFVVAATHCQGWKLTKTLAVLMLIFYVGFLAMAIVLEPPFEAC
jgi:Ca2+/Na+ antiporter